MNIQGVLTIIFSSLLGGLLSLEGAGASMTNPFLAQRYGDKLRNVELIKDEFLPQSFPNWKFWDVNIFVPRRAGREELFYVYAENGEKEPFFIEKDEDVIDFFRANHFETKCEKGNVFKFMRLFNRLRRYIPVEDPSDLNQIPPSYYRQSKPEENKIKKPLFEMGRNECKIEFYVVTDPVIVFVQKYTLRFSVKGDPKILSEMVLSRGGYD
jgi:hypothetical protein